MRFEFSKEPPHWDGSFEYPQRMFWLRNEKKSISHFYLDACYFSSFHRLKGYKIINKKRMLPADTSFEVIFDYLCIERFFFRFLS